MVGSVNQPIDARHCDGPDCGHDQLLAPQINAARSGYLAAGLILLAGLAAADPIRIATYTTELSRRGPELLLRDIEKGEDPQVAAVRSVIDMGKADVLALYGIDWDLENRAISALNDGLASPFPYVFSIRPNSGVPSGQDLDGDGMLRGSRNALGFGDFSGQDGMVVLSRHPIDTANVIDLSGLLWRDFPGASQPVRSDGRPYYSQEKLSVLPLSTTGHWSVPIRIGPDRVINLLTLRPTPPVFDGPEDRNGMRNGDEVRLWGQYLSGNLHTLPGSGPHVLAGNLNLDPNDGDGNPAAFSFPVKRAASGPDAGINGRGRSRYTGGGKHIPHRKPRP